MINITTIVYTIIDDILKSIKYKEYKRKKMNDAEVITTGLIACINVWLEY